jgi:hypothetical protein
MDELLRLLAQYQQGITDLTDDELGELLAQIRAEADAVLDDDPTDEQLDTLEQARDAVRAIEAEQQTRENAAAERSERAQRLRDEIVGQGDGDGEGEGGEGDGEGAGDGEGEGGEGDGAAGGGDGGDGAGEGEGGEGDGAGGIEAVAAAAGAGARRTPAPRGGARANARRPAQMGQHPRQRRGQGDRQPLQLVAAANLPDIAAGTPLDDPLQLARAFMSAYQSARGYRGPRVKVQVARVGGDPRDVFGAERYLGRDAESNEAVLARHVGAEPIRAAGGICIQPNVNYDLPTVGTDARPFRDQALTRFGADRGGVSTLPSPIITDVAGAVDVWTELNDQNPGVDPDAAGPLVAGPATKPCITVDCPNPETTIVEAITRCLEFGNFRARFFPEQVRAWLDLVAVQHARFAENRLIAAVGAGSTQVTQAQALGTTSTILTTLDRAVAAMESRWRIADDGIPLHFSAPAWLLDQIRSDLARQMPGGMTTDERYAAADTEIQRWIEARGVNVTWFLDGEAGQIFPIQGDGPLVAWPANVICYLYPEGSWLFLDGGELDLGIVRDSATNATNDYQVFAETFEGAHFHGIETQRLTITTCPDGSVAGTVAFDPCP